MVYMTKKQARAECRKLAIAENASWWSLCWNKHNGYYPAASYKEVHTDHICWVTKAGEFKYASKENERIHQLKGNIPWIDPNTGKRK